MAPPSRPRPRAWTHRSAARRMELAPSVPRSTRPPPPCRPSRRLSLGWPSRACEPSIRSSSDQTAGATDPPPHLTRCRAPPARTDTWIARARAPAGRGPRSACRARHPRSRPRRCGNSPPSYGKSGSQRGHPGRTGAGPCAPHQNRPPAVAPPRGAPQGLLRRSGASQRQSQTRAHTRSAKETARSPAAAPPVSIPPVMSSLSPSEAQSLRRAPQQRWHAWRRPTPEWATARAVRSFQSC